MDEYSRFSWFFGQSAKICLILVLRPENNLQRARNDLKGPATSKTQPRMTRMNKTRSETTKNKQILRLFYNMGQSVLFSDTFLTQHLVAIIRALLHGES